MGSLFAASSGLSCSEQSTADATCRDCYPETFGDIQQPLPPSPKFRRVRVWLIEFDRDDFHHIFNALLVLGWSRPEPLWSPEVPPRQIEEHRHHPWWPVARCQFRFEERRLDCLILNRPR